MTAYARALEALEALNGRRATRHTNRHPWPRAGAVTTRSPAVTELERAISTIARHAIHAASSEFGIEVEWSNYPEICEGDWECVVGEVVATATPPGRGEYAAAYAFLTARARDQDADAFDGKLDTDPLAEDAQ